MMRITLTTGNMLVMTRGDERISMLLDCTNSEAKQMPSGHYDLLPEEYIRLEHHFEAIQKTFASINKRIVREHS